ncbi:cobaltochelatase subunit CobN, partial [Geminicoccus harenae]
QAFAPGIARAAAQAAAWLRLRHTAPRERRVALVLANYPVRDGRLANGVGLDTPASATAILKELEQVGYNIQSVPHDGNALIRALQAGVTNVPPPRDVPADAEEPAGATRQVRVRVPLEHYRDWFARLPVELQRAVTERWGAAEADPFCRDDALLLPVLPLGQVVVALQPARGYEIDPATSWHDPALVPPHRYLAFYLWLRHGFAAHAVVQVGKHGNLEWLPGKATGLSDACYPAALLGPVPLVYPFIVNDPGEGSQAKRRTGAVIIDHLTPPLVRAGLHGDLQALENLLDEYAEARDLDPKRAALVARAIVEEAARLRLDRDLAAGGGQPDDTVVALDAWLCELKELQIRDGLHVLGQSPIGRQRAELLASLARLPRGSRPGDASLTRALAADLGLAG